MDSNDKPLQAAAANTWSAAALLSGINAVNVKDFGAVGDGRSDDTAAIEAAKASFGQLGGILGFPAGTYRIRTNMTFNSDMTLAFAYHAALSLDPNVTVTLNGAIQAELTTIFLGAGQVAGRIKTSPVRPEWWGAVPDGVTDSTSAIQQAINAAAGSGRAVKLAKGRYRTTAELFLPTIERPNTAGTQGDGFTISGAGMYDSGLIYTGTGYAIYSSQTLAEAMRFSDFYINHAHGGGICLPQGADQLFERFFSSACGAGKYGIWIQGSRDGNDPNSGAGSYMLAARDCRFWSETGYYGTGVRIENVLLCATFENCFFSNLAVNRSHLEIMDSAGITITNCAFERLNQPQYKEPLIRITRSTSISIIGCHAEPYFEAFVGIYGNSSHVLIDSCRLDHYAINAGVVPNNQPGYIVSIDPTSLRSKHIIVGKRNTYYSSVNESTVHGSVINDPVGCVTVEGFFDSTPYDVQGTTYELQLTEKRTIPFAGDTGHNLLRNPSLYSDTASGNPFTVAVSGGLFDFTQLRPSGCRVVQKTVQGTFVISMSTVEALNKYDKYTIFMVGKNNSGTALPIYLDVGGDGNEGDIYDYRLHVPRGTQTFTLSALVPKRATARVDLVFYNPMDLNIYAIYVVPNTRTEVPYGSEVIAGHRLDLGREIRYGLSIPKTPGKERGEIVFHALPTAGGSVGWVYTDKGWKPFGKIDV